MNKRKIYKDTHSTIGDWEADLKSLSQNWQTMYGRLRIHYGFAPEIRRVQRRTGEEPFHSLTGPLGQWCKKQIEAYKKGRLPLPAVKLLIRIGFPVVTGKPLHIQGTKRKHPQQAVQQWHWSLDRVRAHLEANEWQWPSRTRGREEHRLQKWWHFQRLRFRRMDLPAPMALELKRLDNDWQKGHRDRHWEETYQKISKHLNRTGRFPEGKNSRLAAWLYQQRRDKRDGVLPRERFNKLNRLGFTWELPDYRMQVEEGKGRLINVEGIRPHEKRLRLDPLRQRRFLELVTFRKRRPDRWPRHHSSASERERSLAKWCDTLRGKKKKGRLASVWVRALNTLDFPWRLEPLPRNWDKKYRELAAFRKRHPDRWPILSREESMAKWCITQRRERNRGNLKARQISNLDDIGFPWDPRKLHWEERCRDLLAFHKQAGRMPSGKAPSNGERSLGRWVRHVRGLRRKGKWNPEKHGLPKKLEALILGK